ncbi:hypothetical protein [Aneurinibacillus terranovensis]|uniref:hypothetical protein n=1 Tax=Aneurinibacillus terranovensis TaxID=278991 RepID=UPI0004156D0C|nr:hypothetical protein [Aneurinibacillus terranovensis]
MNKSAWRGFGAGIIVATGVLSFAYFITAPAINQAQQAEKTPDQSASSSRTSESTSSATASATPASTAPVPGTKAPQPAAKQVHTVSLNVTHGMTPEEVAAQLEKAKIIPDKKVLIKYFVNNKLMYALKRGTHQVNSEMTIDQIAKNLITP